MITDLIFQHPMKMKQEIQSFSTTFVTDKINSIFFFFFNFLVERTIPDERSELDCLGRGENQEAD